jgi:hypothetical protein
MDQVALRLNVRSNIRNVMAVSNSDHLMHNPLDSVRQKCEIFFHHFLIIRSVWMKAAITSANHVIIAGIYKM